MQSCGDRLLCLPTGFIPADTLRAGEDANASDLVGLSSGLSVPPISLTEDGEWVRPTDTTPVPALIVDFADAGAECLSQADVPYRAALGRHRPRTRLPSTSLPPRPVSRQKSQAELFLRDGSFAKRLRQSALRRISPTMAEGTEPDLMTRYFERFGGYGSQKLLGLVQYQLAQVSDLLAQGSTAGACDLVAQLIIMVDQVNADGGKHDLAFLFSLQPDPPAAVFVNHPSLPTAALRPFSPLADARLVASTLAYVKEIETLSSRRLEYGGPPKKPGGPPSPPKLPATPPGGADPSAEPALTKKQPRAAPSSRLYLYTANLVFPELFAGLAPMCPKRPAQVHHRGAANLCKPQSKRQGHAVELQPEPREAALRLSAPCTPCEPPPGLQSLSGLPFSEPGCHREEPPCFPAGTVEKTDFWAWAAALPRLLLAGRTSFSRFLAGPVALMLARILEQGAGIPANDLPFPAASLEKKSTALQLMKLWSTKGLLRVFHGPASDRELVRTFGSYKNEDADRMIGDRRGPNSLEGRVLGPSRFFPPGQLLTNMSVPRFSHMLVGASTDRSDFYHQIGVSTPRSLTNRVGPALCATDLIAAGLQAHLPHVPRALLADPTGHHYHGAFQALFQGDHGGVEYATAGHESLLVAAGLLKEGTRLKGRSPVPLGDFWDGLIIDDFFALSCEPVSSVDGLDPSSLAASLQRSRAGQAVERAKAAYNAEGVKGSDHKDVLGSLTTRAGGAHIDSELATVAEGASARVSSFFTVALGGSPSTADSGLVALPRGAAQEVALLSALAPVIASNVAVPVSPFAYCSDASLAKGAACVTYVGESVSAALWANSGKKGFYTSLDGHRVGQGFSNLSAGSGFGASPSFARPLGMDFDFVEVGGPGAFLFFRPPGRRLQARMLLVFLAACEDPPSPGLENVLVNDVLCSHQWFETQAWRWQGRKHINVYESEAALRVYRDLCLEGGDLRFNALVDSSVTLGSHAKGRSSAKLLGPSLRKVGATLVAGGLYPAWHYAPTRLNPSDDPTRDQPCRSAAGPQLANLCSPQLLGSFGGLTKPRANWLRLFLVVGGPLFSTKRRLEALLDLPGLPRCSAEADHSALDFDATLGYPGEGPACLWLCFLFLSLRPTDSALGPRDAGDLLRMRNRASSLQEVAGFSLETLLQAKPFDPEDLCSWLTTYGRDLYNSGRPYWHYAETVNAVTAARNLMGITRSTERPDNVKGCPPPGG
ncbi:unnamed protein product [Symbiodinium sp. KB8]|nr:unnamed protein product [Symbiodinium sp. KB8]